ncbi:MAG: hypothetical protein ACFFBK_00770 [Promethearchaeota archaeon]
MLNDIFQVDWILIDTIIIILLFLLLIGVRIFKSTHRWRSSFSNEYLEYFFFPDFKNILRNQFFQIKKWHLTRDVSLKENYIKNPLILIFRKNFKRKLLQVLTEGLGSTGFNVAEVKIKVRRYPESFLLKQTIIDELKLLISTILDYLKKNELIENQNYVVMSYLKCSFSYSVILNDNRNKGLILINPKVDKENLRNFYKLIEENIHNDNLYVVFSKKSKILLPNKNLKRLINKFPFQKLTRLNILTLDKAKNSFKYYETILLGIIIDIIENKLSK